MHEDKTVEKLYQELGLEPPEHIKHLTEDELREKLKVVSNHKWSQQGTTLRCTCELGTHATQIPPTHILTGTDESGRPVLKRVEV